MSEKLIHIDSLNPVDIYGVNDKHLNQIRKLFPKLKIIARGSQLKIIGEESSLIDFEKKFGLLLLSHEKFGRISDQDIDRLMNPKEVPTTPIVSSLKEDVLIHGKNGLLIKARTENQKRMVEENQKNDMLFAIGPAGTGKTYTAVALAVKALKNKEVKRIILTRPAVEAGENLGFLPGDLKEKLDPYLQPLYDALRDMLPPQKLLSYIEDRTIEIAPLAFMRGRTLENAFVILDEAQNTTPNQLKMFLTRMGKNAKFIITGDISQIDLPRNQLSGLKHAMNILRNINGISFVMLTNNDIVRNKLVTKIISAYKNDSDEKEKK